MRVHHLNCGTFCPAGGAHVDGRSHGLTGRLVCHCLLIETDREGLVLVDTGLGARTWRSRIRALSPSIRGPAQYSFRPRQTAICQVEPGFFAARRAPHRPDTPRLRPRRRSGGLPRGGGPCAGRRGRRAPQHRKGFVGRAPLPAAAVGRRWSWTAYRPMASRGSGSRLCELEGLPPEILLIPLRGHTRGMQGWRWTAGGWLLHAATPTSTARRSAAPATAARRACAPIRG